MIFQRNKESLDNQNLKANLGLNLKLKSDQPTSQRKYKIKTLNCKM